MKKYVIKKHYEATDANTNFKGEVHDYYEGKAEALLSEDKFPAAWLIEAHSYTTLSGAKRGLKKAQELAEWETNKGWWKVTAELVEV